MNFKRIISLLIILMIIVNESIFAQISGIITNENDQAIGNATIINLQTKEEQISDSNGLFTISKKENKKTTLKVIAFGYEPEFRTITHLQAQNKVVIKMSQLSILLDVVEVKGDRVRQEVGSISLDPKNIGIRPDPVGGVEGMLKILVGSRNEMSSQYSVRGGNFDENLVYINGFEVYRPFLVRSGQQEGLSIINPDMTGKIDFSTGGFQSRFGDKMSSSLDITYRKPKQFGGSVMASLLGAQIHLEGTNSNRKFTYLIGARQKSNQYFLQSQPTKGQYTPSFLDLQGLFTYAIKKNTDAEIIINYARNRFNFQPTEVNEVFGLLNDAYRFKANYSGNESDQFDAGFAGLSITNRLNDRFTLKGLVSYYQTNEKETYDLSKEFLLTSIETDLGKNVGEDVYSLGAGVITNHARNYLNANIINTAIKGSYALERHYWQFGLEHNYTQIIDKLSEWEYRDSAGYSQPHNPSAAAMFTVYKANNEINYQRISAFIQDNIILNAARSATMNVGLRLNYSLLNKELLISPRVQFSYKPKWEKDIVFRAAAGLYGQPPFYREMRSFDGPLFTSQKAQKSFHVATGFDYNFTALDDRPFKITGEIFYKYLWDLVPYEYDNVRIRYYPDRTGVGYAYGGELRLFGDLVKNSESWLSIGYLKTENKIKKADGTFGKWFPRPTDQRFTTGLYFSDYFPRNKNFKVFLNLMYASGIPFFVPRKDIADKNYLKIPDYKRVDVGFAALLLDGNRRNRPYYSLFNRVDDIWLSLEVFNMIGNLNTLSYQFIQPIDGSTSFAVPNRLTSRLINLKLAIRF